jgi:flagellar biosynthesis protein FliP
MGFLAAFGVVLILLGLCLRMLKRFSPGGSAAGARLPMEVVQRLALAPKQGIAVVRIGERVLAVSIGEGGVRPLMELQQSDIEAAEPVNPGTAALDALPQSFRALLQSAGESPRGQQVRALLHTAGETPRARKIRALLRTASRTAALLLLGFGVAMLLDVSLAAAQAAAPEITRADSMITRLAPQMDLRVGSGSDGLRLSGTVGVVVMMGLLTLLPTLLLMTTSFTRILIVLHFLRQALGTQSAPPAHLISALALLLTGFVMAPTFSQVNQTALQPWMDGRIEQGEMLATAAGPFREFMLEQTRDSDLGTFLDLSDSPDVQSADDVPLVVLMSAFVTSELRTAFQIGFALFLPFIIIDVVVASVLMSMGMFMLPPPMIALPFKILLFVLVDGWTLIVQGLVASFR